MSERITGLKALGDIPHIIYSHEDDAMTEALHADPHYVTPGCI